MQWRIQDFPLGGRRPVGGAPTSDVYTFPLKHMRKGKKLILLGGGGTRAGGAPPGSANDIYIYIYIYLLIENMYVTTC